MVFRRQPPLDLTKIVGETDESRQTPTFLAWRMIVSEEKGTDSGAGFVFESKEFSFGQDDVEMRRQRCH